MHWLVLYVVVMRGGRSFVYSTQKAPYLLLSPVPHVGCLTWNVRAHVCCDLSQALLYQAFIPSIAVVHGSAEAEAGLGVACHWHP